MKYFRIVCGTLLLFFAVPLTHYGQVGKQEYYELKIYHLKDDSQEATVETFLKNVWLPTMHRAGMKNIGVFKPLETDTVFSKRIYVLTAYKTIAQYAMLPELIAVDKKFNEDGKEYLDAVYSNPPYERIESILLRTFKGAPTLQLPALTNARSERIYELRSYESATEKIYRNKVNMFVAGDEVGLFKRLGFNAVFYADVLAGGYMPNLMYMTTFADQKSHDDHWKAFVDSPEWKRLSTLPEYQHNVSKNTKFLLRPTEYSDY